MDCLDQLQKKLDYYFKDPKLLTMALSHRSAGSVNNERLEFLGDAVLEFIITAELYQRYPSAPEGDLTKMRAFLVNGECLAKIAHSLEISHCLLLGAGEKRSGGHSRQSILADALEALVGAIYLDGGMSACHDCVIRLWGESVNDFSCLEPYQDAKSKLQEWLQARHLPLPIYTAQTSGKAHEQLFVVTCTVEGLKHAATGSSTSRRKAEQIAAETYLRLLNE